LRGGSSSKKCWDLEVEERAAAREGFKLIGMYKVAGQRRVIAIVEIDTADNLDRVIFGRLPLREYLEFEAIWPLRTFDDFLKDCGRPISVRRRHRIGGEYLGRICCT
jgi:muconolactone D-isomerase